MTPNELFTKQYFDLLEQEDKRFDKANRDAMLEAASVLAILYLGFNPVTGKAFQFTSAADPIFAALREKLKTNFRIHTENALKISKFKNEQIFRRMLETPELRGWLNRKIQERTLSQRIWKYTGMYRMELEARIAMGIVNGESERSLIKSVEKFLDHPYDNLIVDTRADWKARRLAVKYNTGTGKFASAYANVKRLARTEIFEAYRRADYLIWKSIPQVRGVLVYLSPFHYKEDSCDFLKGMYPKDFFFMGWHPACQCLAVPIMGGETIKDLPEDAKAYMSQAKTQKWYNKLPFITENNGYWGL